MLTKFAVSIPINLSSRLLSILQSQPALNGTICLHSTMNGFAAVVKCLCYYVCHRRSKRGVSHDHEEGKRAGLPAEWVSLYRMGIGATAMPVF